MGVDVKGEQRKRKCSVEEAARNLRYLALEDVRAQYNAQCIAVGHTSDDQAEEVLLRLIRGSGAAGLGGMSIRYGYVVRPLLFENKGDLRHYLHQQNIPYCDDSSNSVTRFLRNRIRHHLLPLLEDKYNPSMRESLLQSASILHTENSLLEETTEAVFHTLCTEEDKKIVLKLPLFAKEHLAIRRRAVEKI